MLFHWFPTLGCCIIENWFYACATLTPFSQKLIADRLHLIAVLSPSSCTGRFHCGLCLWSTQYKGNEIASSLHTQSCSGLSSLTWLRISPVECLCHFSPTLKKLMFSIKNLQNVAFHVDVGHLTFHLTCFQLPAASLGCSRKVLQPRLAAGGWLQA